MATTREHRINSTSKRLAGAVGLLALLDPSAADRARARVTSMVTACRVQRILDRIAAEGPGFIELRTPPRDLPLDARGLPAIPPGALFAPRGNARREC